MSTVHKERQSTTRNGDMSSIPYDWPNRDCSRIESSAGTDWHVQRAGAGETVLLLHGTAASTHTWRKILPELSKGYDVMAVDLPGHAYTSCLPNKQMSLIAMTDALQKLLQQLDFRPNHIVAHSAGAAIGLKLAQLRGTVRSLIGINAALLPFGGAMQMLFAPMAHFFASTRLMPKLLARRAQDPRAVRRVLEGTGSVLDAEGLDLYQRLFVREKHLAAVLEMMASWDLAPLLHAMEEIDTKILLIVGSADKAVSPKEANELAKRFDHIDIVELQGLGHLAHEEDPTTVLDVIRKYIGAR